MSRVVVLSDALAKDLWAGITSTPPTLNTVVAAALRKALEASTDAALSAPTGIAAMPALPWATQTPAPRVNYFVATPDIVGWAALMVQAGKTPAEAVAVVQAQWAKDNHAATLVLNADDPRLTLAVHVNPLQAMQQALADAAPPGKGKPPPVVPAHVFNPVLSQAGLPQIWYYDEPIGGWPASAADQNGVGIWFATSPLTGYLADKAAVDAMLPPAHAVAPGAPGLPPPTDTTITEVSGNAPV